MKFFYPAANWPHLILSGSADQTLGLWESETAREHTYRTVSIIETHAGPIHCLAAINGRQVLASGAADATVKIWKVDHRDHQWTINLLQTIQTNPRFLPLTLALTALDNENLLLAAAGTKADIYVYATSHTGLVHQVTLNGHEGWIRSLAIMPENDQAHGDLLLASASQDKYIRLWRIHRDADFESFEDRQLDGPMNFESLLSNRAHKVQTLSASQSLTFEALLLGHDDWIYSVAWHRSAGTLRLLSASADGSLAMWDNDSGSGVWICTTRLGEISAQKGSTTATGSMGAFWTGLWSADGQSVVSLGSTGSWRFWNYRSNRKRWVQGVGISGHTNSVMDVAWAKNSSYLLSTGYDQTTRLHAQWINERQRSWHEFVRPQIHGYNLNCIDTLGDLQFVSGADEKLLRVFDEPKGTAELLRKFCGVQNPLEMDLPAAANVPVLGLSNKAVDDEVDNSPDQTTLLTEDIPSQATAAADIDFPDQERPPIEDDLARHTLWPETEKLYGHGYETSAVAASQDGSIIATACKASSLSHAVIRLFETKTWREVKPPLTAHSLTVTSLRFSDDDRYLLSTGRDRQWATFERDESSRSTFKMKANNPKAHARMILSACWAPIVSGRTFATAGRDKMCKIWNLDKGDKEATTTINAAAAVTAVDFLPHPLEDMLMLAAATEDGNVAIHLVNQATLDVLSSHKLENT